MEILGGLPVSELGGTVALKVGKGWVRSSEGGFGWLMVGSWASISKYDRRIQSVVSTLETVVEALENATTLCSMLALKPLWRASFNTPKSKLHEVADLPQPQTDPA